MDVLSRCKKLLGHLADDMEVLDCRDWFGRPSRHKWDKEGSMPHRRPPVYELSDAAATVEKELHEQAGPELWAALRQCPRLTYQMVRLVAEQV